MFHKFQLGTPAATFLAKGCQDKAAMAVLFKLMYKINKFNIAKGNPREIAKETGISIRDFNLGIRSLKQFDFIRKYTKKEYMINPEVIYNGDDRQYHVVKHMWDNQTTKGLRNG